MSQNPFHTPSRRGFLAGSAALLGAPALAQSTEPPVFDPLRPPPEPEPAVRRNISSFRSVSWEPYFSNLKNGAILVDTRRGRCITGPKTTMSTSCSRPVCR